MCPGTQCCVCVQSIHSVTSSGSSDGRGTLGWQRTGMKGPSSSSHCHFFVCLFASRSLFVSTNFNLFLTKSPVYVTIDISVYTSHIVELIRSQTCSWIHTVCLQSHKGQPLGNLAGCSPHHRFTLGPRIYLPPSFLFPVRGHVMASNIFPSLT